MTDREDRCRGAVDRDPRSQGIAVCEQLRGLSVVVQPLRCAAALEDSDLRVGRGGLADDPKHRRGPRERAAPELDQLRDDPARVGLALGLLAHELRHGYGGTLAGAPDLGFSPQA